MPRKRKKQTPSQHSSKQPTQPEAATAQPATLSPAKNRIFTCISIVVIPLLLLGIVEAGLRFQGYGFSPYFFSTAEIEGETTIVPNRNFGKRFFPEQMARAGAPFEFSPEKKGQFRIFILGESAAMGDPQPEYGFSHILEVLLEKRYPHINFEIINTGVVAINSHAIRFIADDCLDWEPDLFIVYMGNNEVVGPYGAGTVLTAVSRT